MTVVDKRNLRHVEKPMAIYLCGFGWSGKESYGGGWLGVGVTHTLVQSSIIVNVHVSRVVLPKNEIECSMVMLSLF